MKKVKISGVEVDVFEGFEECEKAYLGHHPDRIVNGIIHHPETSDGIPAVDYIIQVSEEEFMATLELAIEHDDITSLNGLPH